MSSLRVPLVRLHDDGERIQAAVAEALFLDKADQFGKTVGRAEGADWSFTVPLVDLRLPRS